MKQSINLNSKSNTNSIEHAINLNSSRSNINKEKYLGYGLGHGLGLGYGHGLGYGLGLGYGQGLGYGLGHGFGPRYLHNQYWNNPSLDNVNTFYPCACHQNEDPVICKNRRIMYHCL